jgi:hypothetical protein
MGKALGWGIDFFWTIWWRIFDFSTWEHFSHHLQYYGTIHLAKNGHF